MKGGRLLPTIGVVSLLTFLSAPAFAEPRKAKLDGFQEVAVIGSPVTSIVSSLVVDGEGTFKAKVKENAGEIEFKLEWSGLTGDPLAAHIHLGQPGTAGNIAIHLCGTGGKPACPAGSSGTLEGTLTAADVVAIDAQGLTAGDLEGVLRAMRADATYVNMHTATWPTGEIRGNIK
jgi:hypothetical protein